jgi:hypothetical protein
MVHKSHTYKPYGACQQETWLPWSWVFETPIPLAGWTPIQSSIDEALVWLGYPTWNDQVDTDWRRFLVLVIWYQCLCDIEGARASYITLPAEPFPSHTECELPVVLEIFQMGRWAHYPQSLRLRGRLCGSLHHVFGAVIPMPPMFVDPEPVIQSVSTTDDQKLENKVVHIEPTKFFSTLFDPWNLRRTI